MTVEELREIFNKAEIVTFGHGTPPMYQYYHFTKQNRGASVVAVDGVSGLIDTLANFRFTEYAPTGIPVFVEIEPIDGTVTNLAIENS